MERSLVFIKPDGVKRRVVGDVISRFEKKGLAIINMQMKTLTNQESDLHYEEHVERPFYPGLKSFITSGPVVLMVIEGDNAVAVIRHMVGETDGQAAQPGTIRGDLSMSKGENIVHASDSPESAKREITNFFGADAANF